MLTNSRPKTINTILVMLLLLALVNASSLFTSRIGFGAPNRLPGTGIPPAGNLQLQPGGTSGFRGNNGTNGGDFQNRRITTGFNLFSIFRTLGLAGPLMIYVQLAIPVIGILLLALSFYAIWKQKIWGLNLAALLGLIFLAGALPGLFSLGGRNLNWLRIVSTVVSAAASLPVLALSVLPSVRDYFPKPVRKPR